MDPMQRTPINQAPPLEGYNTVSADPAMQEALVAFSPERAVELTAGLLPIGELAGSAEAHEHARLANEHVPVLHPVDRYGARIDEIEYHPSWHWLMEQAVGYGLGATAWTDTEPDAHLLRAAGFVAWGQAEQGHLCPVTMTYAAVPALRVDERIAGQWVRGLASTSYDFGLRAPQTKSGLLAGMSMTEKQGGSDLRTNTTTATAVDDDEYVLTGHKWFTSAAMNDVFLTLAKAPGGMTCFVVPRVLPDGSRNPFTIVRLKDKLGNASNASSEIEYPGTHAWRLGEEGRGIRTIIEMVSATRMDCILGSAAIMRRAVAEASWHTAHRQAFGRTLMDQPAMTNVLADLTVETEAATWLGLRLAHAVDRPDDDHEQALRRICLPLAKFWVTKRATWLTGEAMECLGGNGYAEESAMPRLYREAPVNSVWEGSGNVNALDVLRALHREPACLDAWLTEVGAARGEDRRLAAAIDAVLTELADLDAAEGRARRIAALMATAMQASLLLRFADPRVADAFCASRLAGDWGGVFGTLPTRRAADLHAIAERSLPTT